MMQDFVRTSTYQKAIHGNFSDFNVSFIDWLVGDPRDQSRI
jgi:hypothetical protein